MPGGGNILKNGFFRTAAKQALHFFSPIEAVKTKFRSFSEVVKDEKKILSPE